MLGKPPRLSEREHSRLHDPGDRLLVGGGRFRSRDAAAAKTPLALAAWARVTCGLRAGYLRGCGEDAERCGPTSSCGKWAGKGAREQAREQRRHCIAHERAKKSKVTR